MIVTRKEYLTPHYIRVYLTGQPDTLANIANMTVGVNNKILIPPKGSKHVVFPNTPDANDDNKPIMRTYTHRGVNLETQELWIDFVAHGDVAPASGWAVHASPGDELGIMMKPKAKALYPQAEQYLLVGDATAIPVLGAILESLPADAKGQCIIEVHGTEDYQALSTQADIRFTWLHNPHPESGSLLPEAVNSIELPQATTNRFAYIACEFSAVKAIRQYLRSENGWSRDEVYAYSYWKAGVAEDASAEDRRAEQQDG